MNKTPNTGLFANLFKNNNYGNEARKTVIKYGVGTIIIFCCAFLLLNILRNSGSSEYNVQKYFFLYTVPFIFIIAITLGLFNDLKLAKIFMKLIGFVGLCIFLIYLYATATDTLNLTSTGNYAIFLIICVIALAIIFQFLINYMEKLKGTPGFIAQLIFYIPCVFYDIWIYLLEQIRLTPYSIYLLIVLEIILIVIYAYLPDISYTLTGEDNSIQLLTNIEYLDQKKVLASSDVLKIPVTQENKYSKHKNDYLTNYCISMWVYMNPHPPSHLAYNSESEIFSYGYTDKEGIQHVKPMLRYYGGGGGNDQLIERNKYVFYFSKYPPVNQYASEEHTFYDITLENQKWNQIVMNYNRNKVEIYINGNIERTFVLTKDMPMYSDLDNISIGQDNGLDGAVCNVTYYRHALSPDQIALSYNSMSLSNMPVPRKRNNS